MQLHTGQARFSIVQARPPAAALVSLALSAALALCALAVSASAQEVAPDTVAPPPPAPGLDPEGVETLVRGPVHEAFAAPTASDPEAPPVVPQKPPADIDEVQPDVRPEGAIWINGYWEWDPEAKEFIWISGLWRVPPPEMRWVPPYWTEVEGGWQRVPGFWASTAAGELEYRPAPPASLEVGPSSPAPADNYFYIPGTWNYYDSGYRWRSGYWSPYREDWVWCPARWHWTPAGCLYQAGYWDWRPLVRAQYYAPIRFTSPVYLTAGWRYRPWCVVDSSRFFVHLWIGPRSNCYYFGNYYGSYASTYGLSPWCNWSYRSRGCYDPLWSWSHTHYRRHGVDYIGRCKGWHNHFDKHEHERPARTWNEQTRLIADAKLDPRKSQRVVAADLADVVKRDDLPVRLSRLDERERASIVKVSDDLRKLNVERGKMEREARLARGGDSHEGHDGDDHEHASGQSGDKPGRERSEVARTGRTPRIELPMASDAAATESPRVELPSGENKTTPGIKTESPANAAAATSRLDELSKRVTSRGSDGKQGGVKPGDSKKTVRLKLPEQSEAVREVTRTNRAVARAAGESTSGGLKEATINWPGRSEGRPRISRDGPTSATIGPSNLGPAIAPATGGDTAATAGTSASNSDKPAGTGRENRSRTTSRNSGNPVTASDGKPPAIESLSGNSNTNSSRSRRIETPRIEVPQNPSAGESPRIESRSRESRGSQPRISLPSASSGGGSDAPRAMPRASESRGSGGPTRIEMPKISVPRDSAPRIESTPRSSPRIEVPRSSNPSRNSSPRSSSMRGFESRSSSSSSLQSSRSTPARSVSRSEGSRSGSSSMRNSSSSTRSSGGGGGGGSSSSRSRSRNRD